MNYSRVMGNNVELELKRHNWNVEEFADKVGLSIVDAHKLLEGRLFLPFAMWSVVGDAVGLSTEQLMQQREKEDYCKLLQNFREFDNPDNQDKILDMIDMYADLEESL